jgi:HK97 family phage portal protein
VNLLSRLLIPQARAMDASQFAKAMTFESGTHARVSVTQESALSFIAVYASVGIIADSIAAMPAHVFYKRADGGRELAPNQPPWLNDVDGDPNPETDRFTFFHRWVSSLLLDGNGFVFLADRNPMGFPNNLWNLHPNYTTVVRRDGQILFDYQTPDGQRSKPPFTRYCRAAPTGDVLHTKGFDVGTLRALSPIDAAREAVALGLAAEEFGARFFGQGAVPPGVIEVTGDPTPAQLENMGQWFRENYSGRARAHIPAVLSNAKWVSISVTPEAAQFLETRKFQKGEIASLYRVPPHLIGDVDKTTSWGTGIEQQNRMFFEVTLMPWVRRLEVGLNSLLPPGHFVKFDPAGLLRGDVAARYSAYQQGRSGGWLSGNDVRRLEDMEPIPDGDEYLRPQGTPSAEREAADLLRVRADTAGVLIRAGYVPDAVGPALGLPLIPHTGAVPVTVQQETANAT